MSVYKRQDGKQTHNHKIGSQVWIKQMNASESVVLFEDKRSQGYLHETTYNIQFLFPEYLLVVRAIYATRHMYKNK